MRKIHFFDKKRYLKYIVLLLLFIPAQHFRSARSNLSKRAGNEYQTSYSAN